MKFENRQYTIFDIIRLPIKCAPLYGILIAISKLLDGIVPTLQILATARFINTTISVVSSKGELRNIFPSMIFVVLLTIYSWTSAQFIKFAEVQLEIKVREKLKLGIVEKRAKLSYKYIENGESWDLILRVCSEPESKLKEGYISTLRFIAMIIRVSGILIVLITQVWWATLLILVVSIPLFILAIKSGKATYEVNKNTSKYQRKYKYLGEILTGRESIEERALFGFSKGINKKWWEQYETFRKIALRAEANQFIKMNIGSIITSCISIFIIIVLIRPVISGIITIGMFISLVSSIISLVQMVFSELPWLVNQITKNIEFLKDLSNFALLKEDKGSIDAPIKSPVIFNTIEFKNVRFKYPGTDNYILNGMSFIIERGKHYAFVGSNGAGKTTIIKLITGLYNEYEGSISIDSKDIRQYNQSNLKALCSVVYQDFAKYFISFKDNISIGRISGIRNEENDELIQNAISIMELNNMIEGLPAGINTPLGKIKSCGVDVSGGQWQHIAMARTIINPAPLKILDEPTAAFDPISESNTYKKFEEISKGATTILISHRLGSTKLADHIFVIDNGRVVEEGNHDVLISKNGIYAKMYESQKGWYI